MVYIHRIKAKLIKEQNSCKVSTRTNCKIIIYQSEISPPIALSTIHSHIHSQGMKLIFCPCYPQPPTADLTIHDPFKTLVSQSWQQHSPLP